MGVVTRGFPLVVPVPECEPTSAEAAFARHVLPEIDVLYRVALSLTHNAADAEDVVQETLIRAYRSIERFDGRHARAWLLAILRNANVNRTRRRRPGLFADPEEGPRVLDAGDPEPSAEEATVDLFDDAVAGALDAPPRGSDRSSTSTGSALRARARRLGAAVAPVRGPHRGGRPPRSVRGVLA